MPRSLFEQMGVLGLRGRGMMLCALIWGLFAASAVLPLTNTPPRGLMHLALPAIALRALGWPLWIGDVGRGLVWLVPAVVAVIAARRVHQSNLALGMLCFPPIGYAISYFGSFLMWLIFGPDAGYWRGIITVGFYAAAVCLVWVIAKIPAYVGAPLTGPPAVLPPVDGGKS